MRYTLKQRTNLAVCSLTVLLAGCGDLVVNISSCGGVRTIENSSDASIAAGDIASAIEAAALLLTNGSYTDDLSSGNSGTISITGTISSSTTSCGAGCIGTTNNHSITAELANYSFAPGDARITGSVNYGDTTIFTDNNGVISITGNINIFNDSGAIDPFVNYDATTTDPLCNPTTNGVIDTISSIGSTGPTSSSTDQSGFLTAFGGDFTF